MSIFMNNTHHDATAQLDKAAFLKLLKKDCEEWDRELKMEVKRAHAVR